MSKTVRMILILVVGIFVSYQLISQVDHDFFLDGIIDLFLIAVAVLTFACIAIVDFRRYSQSKYLIEILPTTVGVLVAAGLLTKLYLLDHRDKSPVKFSIVSKITDFNGVRIDFREDGTYKLCNFCLGADYYRGSYLLSDSIITLDKSSIDRVIESSKLVIRADGPLTGAGRVEKSVYQIDALGEILDRAVDFRIIPEMDGSK